MSLSSAQPDAVSSSGVAVARRMSPGLRPVESSDAASGGDVQVLPGGEVECTVLTPSGTVVAKTMLTSSIVFFGDTTNRQNLPLVQLYRSKK